MGQIRFDITGQCFGKRTVLGLSKIKRGFWDVRCDCGKESTVRSIDLRRGIANGCLSCRKRTHGGTHTPEYRAYNDAKNRCSNPNTTGYSDYGGRGIEFRFISFEQFFAELGLRPSPKHSLDRPNNDGHYELGNVRWATRKEQNANKRRYAAIQNFSTEELFTELKRRRVL